MVGDTHERHEGLGTFPECDIFVHCGDILMTGRFFSHKSAINKLVNFNQWLATIPAKKRIVVAGNHDKQILVMGKEETKKLLSNCEYLENEGTTYSKLRIWGTPASYGRSRNKAFQSKEFHTLTKEQCPHDVDILITHGSVPEIEEKVKHKLHFCGHNHNSYGVNHYKSTSSSQDSKDKNNKTMNNNDLPRFSLCAPVHDGHYRLKHLPMIIDVPYEAFHDQATVESFRVPENDETSLHKKSKTKLIDLEDVSSRNNSDRSFVEQVFGVGRGNSRVRPE